STLWYKMLGYGKGITLEEPLYYIRWRVGSLSRGQLKNAKELHNQVRMKYDNDNVPRIKKGRPKKINIKNEKRAVYYSVAAGDFRAARKTAYETWLRFPLSIDTLKLILISMGLRRPGTIKGPCEVKFSPSPKPF